MKYSCSLRNSEILLREHGCPHFLTHLETHLSVRFDEVPNSVLGGVCGELVNYGAPASFPDKDALLTTTQSLG